MCLTYAKIVEQTEDIICYKIFVKDLDHYEEEDEKGLYSPYRWSPYKIGKMKTTRQKSPQIRNYGGRCPCIERKAFHSFKNLDDAVDWTIRRFRIGKEPYCIVECIIPKDSKYTYSGIYDPNLNDSITYPAYACERIKPIRVVKTRDDLFLARNLYREKGII